MSQPRLERGNTVQFTWTSSVAPDSAPIFKVTDGRSSTVVASLTSIQSDSTNYYALYTLPDIDGVHYTGEWFAIATFQGSARQFIKRFRFKVAETVPVP